MPNFPPLEAIGDAFVARLNADMTLTNMAPIVGDEAEDQQHPFVLVPGANAKPWNTLGKSYGWDCELTPVVYSRYEGDLEALQIGERVIALLNDYEFSVPGYATVWCEVDPDNSPLPVKTKTETPKKIERRALAIRFCIKVHE
jgi:hypothetical protein